MSWGDGPFSDHVKSQLVVTAQEHISPRPPFGEPPMVVGALRAVLFWPTSTSPRRGARAGLGRPMTEPTESRTASYVSMRARAVQAVHSPLGFFVLALLIVEGFLFGAGTWFGLSEAWKLIAILVGVLLFLGVFGTVVWLVVKHPKNLVFGEESHVQFEAMKMYGSEDQVVTGLRLRSLPAEPAPDQIKGKLPDSREPS